MGIHWGAALCRREYCGALLDVSYLQSLFSAILGELFQECIRNTSLELFVEAYRDGDNAVCDLVINALPDKRLEKLTSATGAQIAAIIQSISACGGDVICLNENNRFALRIKFKAGRVHVVPH
ncbi:MAG: hypothetical protein HQL20_01265 [Candidatus Omnitrophica bacterium]|nr:hypothetical protein [Candidatus Omnitrophota bacterium]